MNTPTYVQLKQALAKMLPDKIDFVTPVFPNGPQPYLCWHDADGHLEQDVLDTELLHLCWLVEETLAGIEYAPYCANLHIDGTCDYQKRDYHDLTHATWQQRTIALAKVKGIEIV